MKKCVIGICDDIEEAIEQIQVVVESYFKEIDKEVEILPFLSGEAVVEQAENLDILFLDIEMPGMDGIEAGERIREKNRNCKIIMATSRFDRIKEAFKINAFRFVSKPFVEDEIREALSDGLQTMIGFEAVEFYENRLLYDVPQREISVIKAYDSFVEAFVGKRCMRKDTSLSRLLEQLDSRLFFQIDRRYVINMLHVEVYKKGTIWIDKEKYTISRRRRKDFERVYQEFDLTYGGKRY